MKLSEKFIEWRDGWYEYSSQDREAEGFPCFQEFNLLLEELKEMEREE